MIIFYNKCYPHYVVLVIFIISAAAAEDTQDSIFSVTKIIIYVMLCFQYLLKHDLVVNTGIFVPSVIYPVSETWQASGIAVRNRGNAGYYGLSVVAPDLY
ncbi:hypothetical protein ECKG_02691 [Escherichia coli TA206]|nr:hypothetical protein ECKG_02691 [Escherichia coli TA206]